MTLTPAEHPELVNAKEKGLCPEWYTQASWSTIKGGYLLSLETPLDMYKRVSRGAANRLNKPELEGIFFNMLWKGWLGLATPVAANMGAERGLPISCFSSVVPDTISGIFETVKEVACMTAKGGGTAAYLGRIRPEGAPIKDGGISGGVVPWTKILNEVIYRVNQSGVRRGALAAYLDVDHKDFEAFLKIRKANNDPQTHCPFIHQGVVLEDAFMQKLLDKDKAARETWIEIINTRLQTGEPYLLFKDNVNRANPACYKDKGLEVLQSNLCNEIALHTDEDHSLVCCLSSLNLAKYDEWKDTDTVYYAIYFLDAVMEEFIQKAKHLEGFERAVRFAEKSRALGLGVLGYHTYLQSKGWPFGSDSTYNFNKELFASIHAEANRATADLAAIYGEPEWCKGHNRRNTHLLAIAPTVSNSTICGNVSAGIEPITGSIFIKEGAKAVTTTINPILKSVLMERGKDTDEVWSEILADRGSVARVDFLTEEEKEIFLTAREIDQFHLIRQAADRTPYIDQAQSLNVFFHSETESSYINKLHLEAWKLGVKSLYYCRSESVLTSDNPNRRTSVIVEAPKECELPSSYAPEVTEGRCIPCEG